MSPPWTLFLRESRHQTQVVRPAQLAFYLPSLILGLEVAFLLLIAPREFTHHPLGIFMILPVPQSVPPFCLKPFGLPFGPLILAGTLTSVPIISLVFQ